MPEFFNDCKNRVFFSLFSGVLLSLAACGGSGDGGKEPPRNVVGTDQNEEQNQIAPTGIISEAEFGALLSRSGVWLAETDTDFRFNNKENKLTGKIQLATIFTVDASDPSMIRQQNCELDAPTALTGPAEFPDPAMLPIDPKNPDSPTLGSFCDSLGYEYVKIDDRMLQLTMSCNDEPMGTANVIKLSDTATFNHGSLSFTMDSYDDLSATSELCVNYANIDLTLEVPVLGLSRPTRAGAIHLAAPYNGQRVKLILEFLDNIQPGTFEVGNINSVAKARITSPVFGGGSAIIEADSGTVTIDYADNNKGKGQFDLNLPTGRLEGTFEYNLDP